jgi:3-oxoacyl-[acyl-carrier protein] reductase
MKLLQNKVALITGGSRGIGEGIVLKFAEQGAHIAFTYVSSDERANALVEKVKALGVNCSCYKSDAGNFAASEQLVNNVIKDFNTIF